MALSLSSLLDAAPGPTPWYIASGAREIDSRYGRLEWRYGEAEGNRWEYKDPFQAMGLSKAKRQRASIPAGLTALESPDGSILALLSSHQYVVTLSGVVLAVWWVGKADVMGRSALPWVPKIVTFRVIDVDRLLPIDIEAGIPMDSGPGPFIRSNEGVIDEFSISAALPAGTHRVHFPAAMSVLDELPFLVHADGCVLWIARPRTDALEVHPQDWFNQGDFDFGYQWPTRIVRHPETGELTGDGIRIGAFVLDSTYRNVARWQ